MKLISIVAQATPAAPASGPAPKDQPAIMQFIPIILLVVIFYLFMFRPNKGRTAKRDALLSNLKKGDEVQTIGGEFGRVVDTRDDRVLLKVDETSNTKIWYAKSAIHRVVTEEKAEAK